MPVWDVFKSRHARIFVAVSATWLIYFTSAYALGLGRHGAEESIRDFVPFPIDEWMVTVVRSTGVFPYDFETHYIDRPNKLLPESIGFTANFYWLGYVINGALPLAIFALFYALWFWALRKPKPGESTAP